jgi:hypothetical protein
MSYGFYKKVRKMLKKIGNVIILLFLFLVPTATVECKHASFDIRDENIGFKRSPNSTSNMCLLPEIVIGETTTIYHGAAVEPTVAVNPKDGKYVVAAWQQDRINNFGCLDLGIARSKDGGKSWKQSIIPLQNCNGGFIQRVSDVWLSYAADGSRVYMVALLLNATLDPNTNNQSGVITTYSEDNGKTWSIPHFVFASLDYLNEPTGNFPDPDKTSITADPNIPNNAYAVWDTFPQASSFHADTYISLTNNGGLSWFPNQILYNPFPDLTAHNMSNGIYNDCQTIGNIVVGLPNGRLINFMARYYAAPGATDSEYTNDSFPYQFSLFDIALVTSADHGVTWTSNAVQISPIDNNNTYTGGYTYNTEGEITGGVGEQTRTEFGIFNANVNPKNGNLYVVWQTGQFRADQLPQIALSTSRDGGNTWSRAVRVNKTPQNTPNPQAFTPAVAVAKNGYVGILYHDFRNDDLSNPDATLTDAWFVLYKEVSCSYGGSTGIGLDFVKEVRVSKHSYIMQNGPDTTIGVMTNGDYNQLMARDDDFYAIYVKSHNGPFNPPTVIYNDTVTDTVLLLDDNKRTSPYFSKIDS